MRELLREDGPCSVDDCLVGKAIGFSRGGLLVRLPFAVYRSHRVPIDSAFGELALLSERQAVAATVSHGHLPPKSADCPGCVAAFPLLAVRLSKSVLES